MELLKCQKSDKENAEKYILKDGEKELGYGYIYNTNVNPVEIFVYEALRSNGYGKILFSKLIQILKEKGIKIIEFEIPEENYRMTNIISSFGGHYSSIKNGIRRYVFPIK